MSAKEKVAHRKRSMLQLAEKLRKVSEACHIMGHSPEAGSRGVTSGSRAKRQLSIAKKGAKFEYPMVSSISQQKNGLTKPFQRLQIWRTLLDAHPAFPSWKSQQRPLFVSNLYSCPMVLLAVPFFRSVGSRHFFFVFSTTFFFHKILSLVKIKAMKTI